MTELKEKFKIPVKTSFVLDKKKPYLLVHKCAETGKGDYLQTFVKEIRDKYGWRSTYFLDYPIVYIHTWTTKEYHKDKKGKTNSFIVDKIYVGEAEDVVARQQQHWSEAKKGENKIEDEKEKWQAGLVNDHIPEDIETKVVPTLYVIACNLFTKSMTLEIEDKLMNYAIAMNSAGKHPQTRVLNGRYNPQREYYCSEFANDIFRTAYNELVHMDSDFFPDEKAIQKSVFYKMSPHTKLTQEQKNIKEAIKLFCAKKLNQNDDVDGPKLMMIEGGTGTGKSVLTSTTLFEIAHDTDYNVKFLVNHEEQHKVFSAITKALGLGNDIVYKPTKFINEHNTLNNKKNNNKKNPADIVFVDEAHLVWTSYNQGHKRIYDQYQIEEVIKRSRLTVIMFDEFQALKKEQYFGEEYIQHLRSISMKGDNYKNVLVEQKRMNCSKEQNDWIDSITGVSKEYKRTKCIVKAIPPSAEGDYEIKIFDNPNSLHEAIKKKAQSKDISLVSEKSENQKGDYKYQKNYGLSRLIATYDWDYVNDKLPEKKSQLWKVEIGNFSLPWNYQIEKYVKKCINGKANVESITDGNIKKVMENLINNSSYENIDKIWNAPWQEQEHTINEVGSTYTIQGFDLEYAGVILGPSVRYDKDSKSIYFDINKKKENEKSGWEDMTGSKVEKNGKKINVGDVLLQNELRVLMTRGTQGLYIYAVDDDLREALLNATKKRNE